MGSPSPAPEAAASGTPPHAVAQEAPRRRRPQKPGVDGRKQLMYDSLHSMNSYKQGPQTVRPCRTAPEVLWSHPPAPGAAAALARPSGRRYRCVRPSPRCRPSAPTARRPRPSSPSHLSRCRAHRPTGCPVGSRSSQGGVSGGECASGGVGALVAVEVWRCVRVHRRNQGIAGLRARLVKQIRVTAHVVA